ncbi:MAG: hypothetical protein U0984_00815 [Prosthecobacter sp.]|nr:hypothetical protein [Prosthecobacter sp.]
MAIEEVWITTQIEAATKEFGALHPEMAPTLVDLLIRMAAMELGRSAGASSLAQRAKVISEAAKTAPSRGD